MLKRGKRALIITDRIELLNETGGMLSEFGIHAAEIVAGHRKEPDSGNVFIAMSETLRRRVGKWTRFFRSFDVVIVDECFIAGTKVDDRNIEDIKVGEYVNSYNHKKNIVEKKKVLSTFKNPIKNDLLLINLGCVQVVCTQKHPIFVLDKGYINAENLKVNDRIILYDLRESNEAGKLHEEQLEGQIRKIFKKWFYFLFYKLSSFILCSFSLKKDEGKKSDDEKRNKGKSKGNIKENWTQTTNSWGKWTRYNHSAKNFIGLIRGWLVSRTYSYYRGWVFTTSLQNRHRKSCEKNCNRGGWWLTLFLDGKKEGFKKKEPIRIERVQGISVYEQRNIRKPKRDSKYNFVYNIEVEDNNNYFANGVLVHNCHKQSFNWIAGKFTGYVLGFTATPVRSGKMRQLSDDYADLILGPQVPELIRDGFLVPDKYYGVKSVDMDGVRVSSLGDYREDDMFKRYDRREIYTGAVDNWKRICPGTMTLGFGVNIIHVARLAAEFNAAGVGARFVTSDLSPESEHYEEWRELRRLYSGERSAVLAAWRRREFPVLFNAGILTTGYNVREVETILVSRSTVSLPLWLQILGRGSRTYPGKSWFNVLDFGDNSSRLGYYNQMREWSLWHKQSKGGGAPPVKECKKCKCYVFATLRECPFCGYVFPIDRTPKVAELVAVDYSQVVQRSPYADLERRAEERGYKHGWVITQIILKDGRDGLLAYAKEKGYKSGWVWATEKRYAGLLRGSPAK